MTRAICESRTPASRRLSTGPRASPGPIIFVILTLIAIGVYLAFTIPVAVFPSTDFPRIVVGVDNGVAPINQMQVTVTRPIEEAMNSVPGLESVRSTTSRGSAEINLFFNWNVDMFQTLQYVNAALARVQPYAAAHREAHREPADLRRVSDSGLQPDVGHDAADAALGTGELHHQAAPESRERRFDGGAARRPGAGIPDRAGPREAAAGASHCAGHSRRRRQDQHDRFARPDREQSRALAHAGHRPGAKIPAEIGNIVVRTTPSGRAGPHRRHRRRCSPR